MRIEDLKEVREEFKVVYKDKEYTLLQELDNRKILLLEGSLKGFLERNFENVKIDPKVEIWNNKEFPFAWYNTFYNIVREVEGDILKERGILQHVNPLISFYKFTYDNEKEGLIFTYSYCREISLIFY